MNAANMAGNPHTPSPGQPNMAPQMVAQQSLTGSVPGASAEFTLPGQGGSETVKGLPDFAHTKGTAFLLYPGKATLAALSKAAITTNRTPG